MKFSIKNFFSECDQIRRKLRIWSHLTKKFLMENFIFCRVWLLISIQQNRQKKSILAEKHKHKITPLHNLTKILLCGQILKNTFAFFEILD